MLGEVVVLDDVVLAQVRDHLRLELELAEQDLQHLVEQRVVLELEQVGQNGQLVLVEDVDLDGVVLDAVVQVPEGLVAHQPLHVAVGRHAALLDRGLGHLLVALDLVADVLLVGRLDRFDGFVLLT